MNLRKKKPSGQEDQIARAYARMQSISMDDPEYDKLVAQVKELSSIQDAKHSNRPSNDAMWIVLGGIAQVAIIVAYEHSHVLVSKATGFILKTKV